MGQRTKVSNKRNRKRKGRKKRKRKTKMKEIWIMSMRYKKTQLTNLKFGADASSKPRHAKLVARYESRNRTEFIWAMVLSEPTNMISSTSTHDVTTAAIGFPRHVPLTTY